MPAAAKRTRRTAEPPPADPPPEADPPEAEVQAPLEPDADGVVWRGASALRPFLVAIADLEPFPGNPRRGNVEAVRGSLREFGQVKPVTSAADNPGRIVAGNHFVLAAQEEGYTHVAVVPSEFRDEAAARAYMLADNRTHDMGFGYDYELLHGHVAALAEQGRLAGTGYAQADLDALRAQQEALQRQQLAPEEFPPLNPDDLATDYCCPRCSFEWSGNPKPPSGSEPEA